MPVEAATDMPFNQLSREMTRIIERMSRQPSGSMPPDTWVPAVNLYETAGAYIVCVDLAGVDREAIELTITGCRLLLQGRRKAPECPGSIEDESRPPSRPRVHLMEIDHGPFVREVELPDDIDRDRIDASYRDGLLWIEVIRQR